MKLERVGAVSEVRERSPAAEAREKERDERLARRMEALQDDVHNIQMGTVAGSSAPSVGSSGSGFGPQRRGWTDRLQFVSPRLLGYMRGLGATYRSAHAPDANPIRVESNMFHSFWIELQVVRRGVGVHVQVARVVQPSGKRTEWM